MAFAWIEGRSRGVIFAHNSRRHSDSLRKVAPMSKSQGGKNAVSVLTSESTSPVGRRARVTKKWPRMNTFFWSFLDVKSTTGPAVILGFLFRLSRGHREALHINFLDSKNRSEFHEKMMKNSAGPGGLKRSGR